MKHEKNVTKKGEKQLAALICQRSKACHLNNNLPEVWIFSSLKLAGPNDELILYQCKFPVQFCCRQGKSYHNILALKFCLLLYNDSVEA